MTRKKGITVSQISMVGIRMPALIGGKIIRFYEPFLCVIPPPMSFNWIGWHDSYLGVSRRHDWEYENVSWIFLHFSLISQIFYTRCRAIHTHIDNRRKAKKATILLPQNRMHEHFPHVKMVVVFNHNFYLWHVLFACPIEALIVEMTGKKREITTMETVSYINNTADRR